MTNAENGIAFVTECLGWEYRVNVPVMEAERIGEYDGWYFGGERMWPIIPPFGEDTPEGWAAHKRWVEPWIRERRLWPEWYGRESEQRYELKRIVSGGFNGLVDVASTGYGPLPTAAVEAALELVRKEKGD